MRSFRRDPNTLRRGALITLLTEPANGVVDVSDPPHDSLEDSKRTPRFAEPHRGRDFPPKCLMPSA